MQLVLESDFQLLDQQGDWLGRLRALLEQLPEDWEASGCSRLCAAAGCACLCVCLPASAAALPRSARPALPCAGQAPNACRRCEDKPTHTRTDTLLPLQVVWLNHGRPSATALPLVGRGVRLHYSNTVSVGLLYRRSFALKVGASRWGPGAGGDVAR